jgi:hypothetical protein
MRMAPTAAAWKSCLLPRSHRHGDLLRRVLGSKLVALWALERKSINQNAAMRIGCAGADAIPHMVGVGGSLPGAEGERQAFPLFVPSSNSTPPGFCGPEMLTAPHHDSR